MAHYHAERADTLHRLAVVRSSGPGRLRAACHCGFTSPEFSSAGLAESCVDAHIACERSRAIHIDSAVVRLQSMALQAQKSRSRQWLETTLSQIRERARSLVPVDPQMWSAVDVVIVDDDKNSLTSTASYLASVGNFRVVGEGMSGIDAVALTVVEEPGILVVDDDMAPMDGPSAITPAASAGGQHPPLPVRGHHTGWMLGRPRPDQGRPTPAAVGGARRSQQVRSRAARSARLTAGPRLRGGSTGS